MGPKDVLKEYETKINLDDFDLLVPLLSEQAIFWFNDGSHSGIEAVRRAFEKTWENFPLERYWLEGVNWIASGDNAAGCTYNFRWTATIDGQAREGGGRGTTILRVEAGTWKIVHEHLSQFPS